MSARVTVADLGRQSYGRILELQRALCRQRMAGELTQDILLLVEHDPVVTLGRGTRAHGFERRLLGPPDDVVNQIELRGRLADDHGPRDVREVAVEAPPEIQHHRIAVPHDPLPHLVMG